LTRWITMFQDEELGISFKFVSCLGGRALTT
jgi:hypothetical protein